VIPSDSFGEIDTRKKMLDKAMTQLSTTIGCWVVTLIVLTALEEAIMAMFVARIYEA
jgi:hypothetical protein